MALQICIFEDEGFRNLYPLSLTRPVYELRCGITSLREKIQRLFPGARVSLHCRGYLETVVQEQNLGIDVNEIPSDECLFVNGRLLADATILEILDTSREALYKKDATVVAAFVKGRGLERIRLHLKEPLTLHSFDVREAWPVDATLIQYPWDLIRHNPKQLVEDFRARNPGGQILGHVYPNATLLNEKEIYIGEGSKIKPGAVLDAEGGPIYIGRNVTVFPNATIEGPAFIGDDSRIKIGAKIYEGTTIGEVCKVGGEVEASIIHSYSNKQHDGFLGHSYLGQWVNLGAGTSNSDLKNNYSTVKVYVEGEMVDTGSLFVGLTMGDHSKSGINTMFNTGTVVGVMCNVYGAGFPPKFIPSYTWGGAEELIEHQLGKALDTARRVMARRDVEMTKAQEEMLRTVFQLTRHEREKVLLQPSSEPV